jgi:hypothetical protein
MGISEEWGRYSGSFSAKFFERTLRIAHLAALMHKVAERLGVGWDIARDMTRKQ